MAVKITQDGIDTVQDNTVTNSKIIDGQISPEDLPSGSTVQVIESFYTTRTSFTINNSDTVVPGSTITITPKLSNSKFKIKYRYFMETNDGWNQMWNIQRDGSRINVNGYTARYAGLVQPTLSYGGAADNNSTPEFVTIETYEESGSTAGTPITFRLVATDTGTSSKTCWLNTAWNNNPRTNYEYGTSEMIIMEIKG